MKRNKYGLSRDIPESIKRQIRQSCGFGCVICGLGIYDYEHVDPEFEGAQQHNPDCMTLLCPQCHSKVTRKMWSKEKVKEAMLHPYCKKTGFASEFFEFGLIHPFIKIGDVGLENCSIPILVKDEPLIAIKPPEELGSPFQLSANFSDSHGNPSLAIKNNEWQVSSCNWDVEVSGLTITIWMETYLHRFLGNRR